MGVVGRILLSIVLFSALRTPLPRRPHRHLDRCCHAFQSPTCQLTRSKQQQRHSSCSDREVTLGVHHCHALEYIR